MRGDNFNDHCTSDLRTTEWLRRQARRVHFAIYNNSWDLDARSHNSCHLWGPCDSDFVVQGSSFNICQLTRPSDACWYRCFLACWWQVLELHWSDQSATGLTAHAQGTPDVRLYLSLEDAYFVHLFLDYWRSSLGNCYQKKVEQNMALKKVGSWNLLLCMPFIIIIHNKTWWRPMISQ